MILLELLFMVILSSFKIHLSTVMEFMWFILHHCIKYWDMENENIAPNPNLAKIKGIDIDTCFDLHFVF